MIDLIVVHCSATSPGMDIGADIIRKWHVQGNGWKDIGYHYVIRRNGEIEKGREENISGAHVRGRNTGSLGICLVGGINENGKADCNFTISQFESLKKLLVQLSVKYNNPRITGHRMLDNGKECPSFDVEAWWDL